MLTDARHLKLPRPIWGVFALISVALGALTAVLLGSGGSVSFTDSPRLELPLPPAPGDAEVDRAMAALPALIEPGPYGPLPRIASDGQRPFLAYAHPFNADDRRAKISVLVVGLGLRAEATAAALGLPDPVGLHFSAYAADLPDQVARARAAGHEVLLDLPMEPLDYPASDPGPHALLADDPAADNLARLDWLLARAPGYIAVAGVGAGFASSASAPRVLDMLARRGLALVEIGGDRLAAAAASVGLPYAAAPTVIDEDPSMLSIDLALAGLEAKALTSGSALGVAQGYPVSLERLRLWAATLNDKGLVLAPVSAFVIEQSGLAAEAGERGFGTQPARG